MCACKGICEKYRAKRAPNSSKRYTLGQRRCNICELFLNWTETLFCPCCGWRLRTKPRTKKSKKIFKKAKAMILQNG